MIITKKIDHYHKILKNEVNSLKQQVKFNYLIFIGYGHDSNFLIFNFSKINLNLKNSMMIICYLCHY